MMIFRFDGCKPSFTCPSLEDAIPNLTPWEAIRAGEAQPGWYKMLNRNPYFSFGGEHSISKPYPFHHVPSTVASAHLVLKLTLDPKNSMVKPDMFSGNARLGLPQ